MTAEEAGLFPSGGLGPNIGVVAGHAGVRFDSYAGDRVRAGQRESVMIAMAAQLFVSYARKDRDHVLPWIQALQALGVSVWMDERGLDGAVLWQQEIVEAIDGCAVLLLMLSPTAVNSRSVQREVTLAIEANKPVLPLILEPVQIPAALRYQLAGIQHIELFAG